MLNPLQAKLIRTVGDLLAPSGAGNGRLCVVNYHRILEAKDPLLASEPDVATFRWQMEVLASCFNVLPLRDAIDMLGTGRMPPRAVAITFDDGYRSVHDLALPILRQFKLPATVFVTSGYVGGGNMWNDRIIETVQSLPAGQLDLTDMGLGVYSLASLEKRQQTVDQLTEATKYLPPQSRLDLIRRLELMVGQDLDHGLMLTPEMVVNLDRAGIEIGAHTVSHPILTSLHDDAARREIENGKTELEAIIGKPVRLFAYPNGKVGKDYDERHTRMAREAGFQAAFTTSVGAVTSTQDRFQLPRSRPWDRSPFLFAVRLLRWLGGEETAASTLDTHIHTTTRRADAQQAGQAETLPHGPAPMTNRVLLTAFHFPPQAASSGIQRTLSFSRHLGSNGWEPMVLSASPRAYSQQNPSQLASVPASLVVRRAFALDTKRHIGIKGRYPEALALPDRWISWWFAGVATGLSLIRQYKPRVLWSTFPIATSHLIGLALHRTTGLPWVADFRDPMLQPSYPVSKPQRAVYAWIERQTITRCAAAVFTTHSAMVSYRERFPQLPPSKFHVIENGYDEDGFGGEVPVATVPGECITLVHSGVLYDTGRDPTPFLAAIAALKADGKVSNATLRVILRAPGEMEAVAGMVQKQGLCDMVKVEPPVPYRDALKEMLAADGLIVFQGTPFNTQIPAKIYEYFRARKPILGLVDTRGETARVLRAAGFDSIAQMDSTQAITPVLERLLGQIRARSAYVATDALIASSSRTHRASQLAVIFDQAIKGNS
ncbi:polysaccharide deacetylase family protein [Massilia sp. PAMC28688]|uniref:polysaccharide deacetylase family protein n=1 Tax=Massilia sp. PAMC28688 TaxID=2861283 RepID=UPI001E61160E|nr:polysaccharide deacetylase family protein [Massilia sp. PAMC28688]